MLTGMSIAFKIIAGILVRMITGPLGIPGGALAGGFYMLWMPLAIAITGHRGAAFVLAGVQTIVMVTTGAPGSHGVWTIVTYMAPAILTEAVFAYRPKKGYNALHYVFATILANMAGTFGSNLLFFRMSLYPLLFTLLAAAVSGALGGIVAWLAFKGIAKTGLLEKTKRKKRAVSDRDSDDDQDLDSDADGQDFENNGGTTAGNDTEITENPDSPAAGDAADAEEKIYDSPEETGNENESEEN